MYKDVPHTSRSSVVVVPGSGDEKKGDNKYFNFSLFRRNQSLIRRGGVRFPTLVVQVVEARFATRTRELVSRRHWSPERTMVMRYFPCRIVGVGTTVDERKKKRKERKKNYGKSLRRLFRKEISSKGPNSLPIYLFTIVVVSWEKRMSDVSVRRRNDTSMVGRFRLINLCLFVNPLVWNTYIRRRTVNRSESRRRLALCCLGDVCSRSARGNHSGLPSVTDLHFPPSEQSITVERLSGIILSP